MFGSIAGRLGMAGHKARRTSRRGTWAQRVVEVLEQRVLLSVSIDSIIRDTSISLLPRQIDNPVILVPQSDGTEVGSTDTLVGYRVGNTLNPGTSIDLDGV